MNKMLVLLLVLLMLHIADLGTTAMVTPEQEGNPIMKSLWINGGFGMMVLAKAASWMLMLAYYLAILKWLPQFEKAVWASQIIMLVAMTALVSWNLCMVL